jgi:DNA-binding LytR/AlgR family response regulator
MKILIAENDIAAYESLKNILEEIDPSIQIAGRTDSVAQTVGWLNNNLFPDLICTNTKELKRFLDKFLVHQSAKRSLPASVDKYPDRMLIPFNSKLIPVDISKVSYFYVTNGMTRVALKDNTGFQFGKALDAIYSMLNPSLFFRANKQFIIAKDSVKNLTIWFDNRLLITLDAEVPERLYVSKNRAALFKRWLTKG